MHFIDDGLRHRAIEAAVSRPIEGIVHDHAARHERGVVALVQVEVLIPSHPIPEHFILPMKPTPDRLGIRIEQELVRIEALARRRIPRSMHAVAVERAGLRFGEPPVEDVIGAFPELQPRDLALGVRRIEET